MKPAMKLTKDGDIRNGHDDEIAKRDADNAVAAVNTYRYAAMRQYRYAHWPEAGEIRDELDKLDKLPLYELHELLAAAGLQHE